MHTSALSTRTRVACEGARNELTYYRGHTAVGIGQNRPKQASREKHWMCETRGFGSDARKGARLFDAFQDDAAYWDSFDLTQTRLDSCHCHISRTWEYLILTSAVERQSSTLHLQARGEEALDFLTQSYLAFYVKVCAQHDFLSTTLDSRRACLRFMLRRLWQAIRDMMQ